jgi:molecular chaperone GrpE
MRKKPSITQLQKQVDELTQALQRERADATNVRRRAEDERQQMANFYKSMIVRELLPAIDNLERSLMHIPKDLKGHDYVKGVRGVIKQFEDSFKKLGVERIKTVGETFDPKLHEAISVEDAGGQVEVVCEELQPGYKLGDEIIRHAMVRVKRG